MTDSQKTEIYREWSSLVNMTKAELARFYRSEDGKKAGLSRSEAKKQGISSGRESAVWIMRMKGTSYKKWTPKMWKWAKKQINFIKRMSGVEGDLIDEDGNPTRKYLALKIWGRDPLKKGAKKLKTGGDLDNSEETPKFNAVKNITHGKGNKNHNNRVEEEGSGKKSKEGSETEKTFELRRRIEEAQLDAEKRGDVLVDLNLLIYDFCIDQNIWFDNTNVFGRFFCSGNENDVYLNLEESTVYKINNLMNVGSVLALFDKMDFHNKLFPETKYSFVGFFGHKFGKSVALNPVFSQQYVPDSSYCLVPQIDNHMKELGFSKVSDFTYERDGIIISDLRPRNTLTQEDGSVYIIDAEFKTKETMAKGGEVKNEEKFFIYVKTPTLGRFEALQNLDLVIAPTLMYAMRIPYSKIDRAKEWANQLVEHVSESGLEHIEIEFRSAKSKRRKVIFSIESNRKTNQKNEMEYKGYKYKKVKTKIGDKYQVQSISNKQRGVDFGGGDSLVGSEKEAKEEIDAQLIRLGQYEKWEEEDKKIQEQKDKEEQERKTKLKGEVKILFDRDGLKITLDQTNLTPLQRGRLVKALDKKWRDSITKNAYTTRERLKKGDFIGKETSVQEYSNRKVNLEYKKLANPKTTYEFKTKDGYLVEVPKIIYDRVSFEGELKQEKEGKSYNEEFIEALDLETAKHVYDGFSEYLGDYDSFKEMNDKEFADFILEDPESFEMIVGEEYPIKNHDPHGYDRYFRKLHSLVNEYESSLGSNQLQGGKADKLTISDIAKKHGVSEKVIEDAVEKGSKVEMEHTNDHYKAVEIAMDHVFESLFYYEELAKMEAKLGRDNELNDAIKGLELMAKNLYGDKKQEIEDAIAGIEIMLTQVSDDKKQELNDALEGLKLMMRVNKMN